MKKKCAVFTIVKNEKFFLPVWIKHYSKFFDCEDIYVLDHQTTDGSTNDLKCNVVQVHNELTFDHQWLCNTIQNFQSTLLQKYNAVLFVESDELVYSIGGVNLREYIDLFLHSPLNYVTCIGFEVMQNVSVEPKYESNSSIFSQRKYWFRHELYDKTLLTKIPLVYSWGFHNCDYPKVFDDKLFLCHLHRFDFPLMLERHTERATTWNIKDDAGASFHQKIYLEDELKIYFNSIPHEIELIPEIHLQSLNGI